MEKQFSVTLRVNGRVADVVAEIGAFADYIETKYGDGIANMTVDTTVHGWNDGREGRVVDTLATPTFTTSPEPSPAPPPPSRRARKAKPTPETPVATTDEHPDLAEPQAEVEGAEAEPEATPAPQPELTRDDVFEALRRLVTTKGNDAAVAALARVGVKKFSDVPTAALPELYAVIQKVLA